MMIKRPDLNPSLGVYVLKAEDLIGLEIHTDKDSPSRKLQDEAEIQIEATQEDQRIYSGTALVAFNFEA